MTSANMTVSEVLDSLEGDVQDESAEAPVPPVGDIALVPEAESEVHPTKLTDQEALDAFPVAKLIKLDELISEPSWVIPVLHGGELGVLLDFAIDLCNRGVDTQSEHCQRFFREGLTVSFTKIMKAEAVSSWRVDVHKGILKNCEQLVELICTKIQDDCFPLLDLLGIVLHPYSNFHTYHSSNNCCHKSYLADLINRFGQHGGFQKIHDRIMSDNNLSVHLIYSLVRPFGLCYKLLSPRTVNTFFFPIIETVSKFLENLTDEEVKKELEKKSKTEAISAICYLFKDLISRIPGQEDKHRVMVEKVLTLFWNIAHSADVTSDIMEKALTSFLVLRRGLQRSFQKADNIAENS